MAQLNSTGPKFQRPKLGASHAFLSIFFLFLFSIFAHPSIIQHICGIFSQCQIKPNQDPPPPRLPKKKNNGRAAINVQIKNRIFLTNTQHNQICLGSIFFTPPLLKAERNNLFHPRQQSRFRWPNLFAGNRWAKFICSPNQAEFVVGKCRPNSFTDQICIWTELLARTYFI